MGYHLIFILSSVITTLIHKQISVSLELICRNSCFCIISDLIITQNDMSDMICKGTTLITSEKGKSQNIIHSHSLLTVQSLKTNILIYHYG